MTGYAIARLDEIDEQDDGRCPWRPVRYHFGITSFGINAWTSRAKGDRIINEHDESDPQDMSEELYIVTTGRAVFELDGERREAPAGTYVFVEPAVKRTAFAEEPATTIVSIGGVPGQAYEPSGREVWSPVRNLYEEGDYEGRDRARPRAHRGESPVLAAAVQPRMLREPRGPDGGCGRTPAPGGGEVGPASSVCEGGLGLRRDPRRAGVQELIGP